MDAGTSLSLLSYGIETVFNALAGILIIIGMWMINIKAGYKGWEALIPFYNIYVLTGISGKKSLFWWYLALAIGEIISLVLFIFTLIGSFTVFTGDDYVGNIYIGHGNATLIGMWGGFLVTFALAGIFIIGIFLVYIFMCIGLAKSFGLNGGYAVGLIFLPFVFFPIIGFSGNIRYIGPDGVMNYGQYV
ncbi:MAG: DUF5684 domain-containing protein [Lachnospiraceae bacterium]|nr:DUF5684 domain-containing protein [Lachnospiraceae bacterium]